MDGKAALTHRASAEDKIALFGLPRFVMGRIRHRGLKRLLCDALRVRNRTRRSPERLFSPEDHGRSTRRRANGKFDGVANQRVQGSSLLRAETGESRPGVRYQTRSWRELPWRERGKKWQTGIRTMYTNIGHVRRDDLDPVRLSRRGVTRRGWADQSYRQSENATAAKEQGQANREAYMNNAYRSGENAASSGKPIG